MHSSLLIPIQRWLLFYVLTAFTALNPSYPASAQQSEEQQIRTEESQSIQKATSKATPLEQLQSLHKSARSSAAKIAATDEWLKAHPQPIPTRMANLNSFSVRVAELSSRNTLVEPTEARASLKWEVRQGLNATLGQSRSSKEAVALTDEFMRLNFAALKELGPILPTFLERKARLLQLSIADSSKIKNFSLRKEIGEELLVTRANANTPAQAVALTEEFLRVNAEVINLAYPQKRKQVEFQ